MIKIIWVSSGTPILGRKLTMRREVREALEVRRRSLQAERRKSQMQTLGAHNAVARAQRVTTLGFCSSSIGETSTRCMLIHRGQQL